MVSGAVCEHYDSLHVISYKCKTEKKTQPFADFYFIFSFINLSSTCLLNNSETILNQRNQMAKVYVDVM